MNKLLTIVAILCTIMMSAQTKVDNSFKKYIPKGYSLSETIYGDLNKDGQEDVVLIIKGTDKEMWLLHNRTNDIVDKNRRGILVLFKKGNRYDTVLKNYSCFFSAYEDEASSSDPDLEVSIDNNNLYVTILKYANARSEFIKYTFRYNAKDFELIGYDYMNRKGPINEIVTSINFLTRKRLDQENINACKDDDVEEELVDIWSMIASEQLLKLSKIKEFDELYF